MLGPYRPFTEILTCIRFDLEPSPRFVDATQFGLMLAWHMGLQLTYHIAATKMPGRQSSGGCYNKVIDTRPAAPCMKSLLGAVSICDGWR